MAATDIKNSSLATGLVSCWELQETSGTRVDSHGTNDLTDNNTVLYGAGHILTNAADFEQANSEYLNITDASQSGLDGMSDLTIAYWFNLESTTDYGTYVSKWGNNTATYSYLIRQALGDLNTIAVYVGDGTNVGGGNITGLGLALATWYHAIMTFNSSTGNIELRINNVLKGTIATSVTGIANTSVDFILGAAYGAGSPYWLLDGRMEQVCVWQRLLTSTEMTDLYNSGNGIPYDAGGGSILKARRGIIMSM